MAAPSLDQILRGLEMGSEVQFNLAHFPIDELLLTLHETRFTGVVEFGRSEEADRVHFRDGKVLDVLPCRYIHVQQLARILMESGAVGGKALRSVIEEDANMDGVALAKLLMERGLVSEEELRSSWTEQARRRLFYLYDHAAAPATVRQIEGGPETFVSEATPIDLLPAVAYGLVVRSSPARRRAMLAFAANKQATLVTAYDEKRNRCGLPPPLVDASRLLSLGGAKLGSVPCLPGLTPQTTAGLLLLFQRIGLLTLQAPGDVVASDSPSAKSLARPTDPVSARESSAEGR
jgi:hypothetical protein